MLSKTLKFNLFNVYITISESHTDIRMSEVNQELELDEGEPRLEEQEFLQKKVL